MQRIWLDKIQEGRGRANGVRFLHSFKPYRRGHLDEKCMMSNEERGAKQDCWTLSIQRTHLFGSQAGMHHHDSFTFLFKIALLSSIIDVVVVLFVARLTQCRVSDQKQTDCRHFHLLEVLHCVRNGWRWRFPGESENYLKRKHPSSHQARLTGSILLLC